MKLQQLSSDAAVKFVKFYCLRKLRIEEFAELNNAGVCNIKSHKSFIDDKQKEKDEHEVCDALENNDNFKACKGNLEALMILSFILRSMDMN